MQKERKQYCINVDHNQLDVPLIYCTASRGTGPGAPEQDKFMINSWLLVKANVP